MPVDPLLVARALAGLGAVLLELAQAQEAEPLLRESVTIRRERLPSGDWRTANVESLLGGCLTALERYEEAEPLLLNSYRGFQAAREPPTKRVEQAGQRVLRLYESWGKPDRAEAWRKQITTPMKPE
jgi:hypothetical protein